MFKLRSCYCSLVPRSCNSSHCPFAFKPESHIRSLERDTHMTPEKQKKTYTLKEACEFLSISTATGRNWLNSGRLIADTHVGNHVAFSETTLQSLKNSLSDGTLSVLNRRRNKSCVSGNLSCLSYLPENSKNLAAITTLLETIEKEQLTIHDSLLSGLLRACAEQLILSAGYHTTALYEPFLDHLAAPEHLFLLMQKHPALFELSYQYSKAEDTLGCLYQSLCALRERKCSGSYYTPFSLATRLISRITDRFDQSTKLLDPCCGTGVFLLNLPETVSLGQIYGNDINPTSVLLTRINLALKYHLTSTKEMDVLKNNITISDFLETTASGYDIILGNPPWGARLSSEAKKTYQKRFFCASGTSVETFDLFTEQGLNLLSMGGILAFLLPEAVLTVKSHKKIRELLLKNTSVLSVDYLGEAFAQIQCPSILLCLEKNTGTPFFNDVSITLQNGCSFSTFVERSFQADYFSFTTTDEEYLLLEKLLSCPNCTTLVDHADFALGIVTGNNAATLFSSPASGLEPIIKGNDIRKYHIGTPSAYIKFTPEQFQQTAPEHLYRAPEKLFYRFINRRLTFALDTSGLLSLNSCNIVIPKLPGLSVKYVLAILNSSAAQFIFEKKFHSVKVLRSHIEQLPIPLADKPARQEIVCLVERLLSLDGSPDEFLAVYQRLDKKVAELFGLTRQEYALLYGSSDDTVSTASTEKD